MVYDAGWQARWASGTGGAGPAYLAVENSGNVAIYRSSDGGRLWQTGTTAPPPPPPSSGRLTAGQRLDANDPVESPNGRFSLVYQTDGNLVLYNWEGSGYWGTGTNGTAPGQVTEAGWWREQARMPTGMSCPGRVVNGLGVSLSGATVVSGAPNRCEEQPAFLRRSPRSSRPAQLGPDRVPGPFCSCLARCMTSMP